GQLGADAGRRAHHVQLRRRRRLGRSPRPRPRSRARRRARRVRLGRGCAARLWRRPQRLARRSDPCARRARNGAAPSRDARFLLMAGYRVGVDVGGTFTDLICVTPSGEIVLDKTPSTLDDQSRGVMNGLGQLAERFGLTLPDLCAQLEILVHGTTTADNTMIEMNGAATGLLVT